MVGRDALEVFFMFDASTFVRVRRPEWQSGRLPSSPLEFLDQLGVGSVRKEDVKGPFDFSSHLLRVQRDGCADIVVSSHSGEDLRALAEVLEGLRKAQAESVLEGKAETGAAAPMACVQILIMPQLTEGPFSCGSTVSKETEVEVERLREELARVKAESERVTAEKDREIRNLRAQRDMLRAEKTRKERELSGMKAALAKAHTPQKAQEAVLKVMKTPQERGEMLHAAVERNDIEEVKLLVRMGADLETESNVFGLKKKNLCGQTPLYRAAAKKRLEIMKVLTEEGAEVDVTDWEGRTPICLASGRGHLEMVKFLFGRGAKIHGKGLGNPLEDAAAGGHLKMVKFLVRKLSKIDAAVHLESALTAAAKNNHVETVKFLVEKGANIEDSNSAGRTAFFRATWFGGLETAKFLFEMGAKIDVVDRNGETPLTAAAQNGSLEIVKFLIEKGAETEVRTKKGETALDKAERYGHDEIAAMLRMGEPHTAGA
uniref:Uncharacterized protein n=1 Tax=Chromera velia CCMP2878 TaxID=1169474 RepID=A0A0G4FGF2_9ALVE|eukprot:Cvel_3314.t1-p1 / transcript=Cvel_3314.t1 / gene=Cvel_3314 / organism=Chromera_velia_CCMP2878 / gene_product=Ankyrin repeat and KH domain-containing protein, putative / transcript_product=Ankyrin repeat and KH domain-containing protein, putative / location=Cvel_scaffold131:102208-106621(-) / protein_length=486 / sequence_SO=supercontig / SO=protein_coding / is_pseudo=false